MSNGFEFKDITDSGTVNVTASADTMSNLPVGSFEYDIQQKVGDVVTATGVNTTVANISGNSLTLGSAATIANGTSLTFTTHLTLFSPVENTPENMFYYCANHSKMGGQVIILTS